MSSFRCPNCGTELQRSELARGVTWLCPSCGGRAAGVSLLRKAVEPAFANAVWSSAIEHGKQGDRPCAVCAHPMLLTDTGSTALDICKRCQFVWFDPSEFDLAPSRPPEPRLELSQDQLERIARTQSEEIARSWRGLPDVEMDQSLEMVPGALGLPIEEETPGVRSAPWLTWFLGIVCIALAFWLGWSWWQTVAGVYFLVVFGDNVEDYLGRGSYALLLSGAAVLGAGGHSLVSSPDDAPLAALSGAVSGIVVFYGIRFPHARLRYFRVHTWLSLPAPAVIGIWALSQFVSQYGFDEPTEVSSLAHAGGALVGISLWWLRRND